MKTIGLIGGMTWESTAVYYDLINREVQKRKGGLHSARIVMHSFDFEDIAALQRVGQWDDAAGILANAGEALVRAGADVLLICTNTMHRVADVVAARAEVPLLHIADPLGEAIRRAGLSRVGLIGTRFTMSDPDVLKARLKSRYDLGLIVPEEDDAAEVHRVIYDELALGRFLEPSRARYRDIIARLVAQGAEGVILGCTEIPLLLKPEDSSAPLFDTTALHAMAAVDFALGTA